MIVVICTAVIFLAMWIGGIKQFKQNVEETPDGFKRELRVLQDDIKKILMLLPRSTVEPGSPLKLSDLRESVSQTLHATDWAENIAETVFERVKGTELAPLQGITTILKISLSSASSRNALNDSI